jgi:RNA polymerase sigma-70 factor, ECF subfamily
VSESEEQNLFTRARSGDRKAFDALHERFLPPMQRFVRRLLGQNLAAEDILREAFLALYRNLERIPDVGSLRPFLYRVIRNLCYSELRRAGRFAVVSLDALAGQESDRTASLPNRDRPLDEQVHWILLCAEVQHAIDRLPEMHRQTMVLYGEEDLTYAQIAEAMATDIGTVKSRLHYARKHLVRILRPETMEALGLNKEK